MPPIAMIIAIAAAAFIAGLGIGWTLGARRQSPRSAVADLEARLERTLENKADYEAEVAEHFQTTAALLNRMTEEYRTVYSHLAAGADKLCDGTVVMPHPGLGAAAGADEVPPHLVDMTQPLDYAPKRPDEQGQLSENFGIERSSPPSDPDHLENTK